MLDELPVRYVPFALAINIDIIFPTAVTIRFLGYPSTVKPTFSSTRATSSGRKYYLILVIINRGPTLPDCAFTTFQKSP